MLIITTLYLALVWLLFFKFKWLPWNKFTQWICLLVGTVILSAFLVGLQSLTPSSSQAVVTARIVDVAPAVSGRISGVSVEAMKPIQRGEVLFEIDPTDYQSRLADLEAQLALARIREDQAATMYERQAGALADLQSAQAQVQGLLAKIDGARFDLDNTTVRAPINGRAPTVFLREGVQVSPSRAVLAFMDDDEMIIAARFAQKSLLNIKIGDTAKINFPALPGQVFNSEVIGVPDAVKEGQYLASGTLPSLYENRMSRQWPVLVRLPEEFPPELRKAGMAAEVFIHTEGAGVVGIVAVILQWISTSLDAVI